MILKDLINSASYPVYSGCGNTFIMIDDRDQSFPCQDSLLIQKMCDRKSGMGTDGVILLQRSCRADVKMRIFNSDGSEAEMCGNGIRCLGEFLIHLGFPKRPYRVETYDRILDISFTPDNEICVNMGGAKDCHWNIDLNDPFIDGPLHFLNTGVPHLCLFVPDVDRVNVQSLGQKLRYHPYFQPKGTNVNFIECFDQKHVRIRTYERGVEGETLACGTGATASALACAKIKGLLSPITITLRSRETLTIDFNESFNLITMTGKVFVLVENKTSSVLQ